jgi:hypothetical protein
VSLLRVGLKGTSRNTCLGVIGAVATELAQVGGPDVVCETAAGVTDVYAWWP